MGQVTTPGILTRVGEAVASPVVKKSTIHDMLEYAEHLFGVSYGPRKKQWEKAYALRNIMVHTRGRVDYKNAERLGIANPVIGTPPQYDWPALRADLTAAFEIAELTDSVLMTDEVRFWEMAVELVVLSKAKQLPKRGALWPYFHDLGFSGALKHERTALCKQFYP